MTASSVIRAAVTTVHQDRILYKDFDRALELVKNREVVEAVDKSLFSI